MKLMKKSQRFSSISNQHGLSLTTSASGFDPIPQNVNNYYSIDQSSSYTSPPHPQPNIQSHEHKHASSFDGQVEVDVKDTLIPDPPSTAHDGQLEPTLGQLFNGTEVEGQTIDVPAASNDETDLTFTNLPSIVISHFRKSFLYRAAVNGDWKMAEELLQEKGKWEKISVTDSITRDNENVLPIAAGSKHSAFVEKLIDKMSKDDMTLKNKHQNTALCFAATSGVVRIAELIVKKNEKLPLILGFQNVTPLFMAISFKRREMASYLLSVTEINKLSSQEQVELLIATIHSNFYDISLEILEKNGELAIMEDTKNNNELALHVLARKPSAIGCRDEFNIWKKCINSCFKGIYRKDMMKIFARKLVEKLWFRVLIEFPKNEDKEFIKHSTTLLHDAAKAGNVEFLILLIGSYPDIVWEVDDDGKSIFHVAVENRLEDVFSIMHEIKGLKDFSTKYRNFEGKYNMLHLAAKLAATNHLNRISGAALQMQRELIWFKEVEKIVLPSQLEAKCYVDDLQLTPRELFTTEHKDLRKDGEEWMKSTANSCMLVATLIATVVFAAGFTIPGGSDNNTGSPIFQRELWFTIFVLSDAIALVSSSTSILMFMSILTSRYAEDDFLHSLPSRLLIGLASLFISIVCMVGAFGATFFMLYHEANIWVPTTVIAMTIVPVSCFCKLQFKLWVDTFYNTYLSRFLFKPRRRKLFSPSTSFNVDLLRKLSKKKR